MFLLLSKSDFPAFVPFSLNIGAHLVEPHIRAAQRFDLRLPGLLTRDEMQALEANSEKYARTEFDNLEFDPREFLAELLETEWDDKPLYTLFMGFVRPLHVFEAFRRLLVWHGHHVTPNGLEVITDDSHKLVSASVRTELRNDILTQANYYRNALQLALRTYRGAAVPTTCGPLRRRRQAGLGGTQHYTV